MSIFSRASQEIPKFGRGGLKMSIFSRGSLEIPKLGRGGLKMSIFSRGSLEIPKFGGHRLIIKRAFLSCLETKLQNQFKQLL